jgi:curved DNA-binding protein
MQFNFRAGWKQAPSKFMAIEYKDYYRILRVSKSSTAEEIRRAFRTLARQHHPDVTGGSENKFKELNEAYEVLSDPAKRSKYDSLGSGWNADSEFQFSPKGGQRRTRGSPGKPKDFDFHFDGAGFSEFFEELFGANSSGGRSRKGERSPKEAPIGGEDAEAEIRVSLDEVLRGSVRAVNLQKQEICTRCFGTTRANGRQCDHCEGRGQVIANEKYQIKIPAGVRDGYRLRIAGRGERGAGSNSAGDLYLRVRLQKHPDFHVEEENLVCDVEIAPWEAVLGGQIVIPTLEGKVTIKVPPGSQSGQRLRLREKGLPNGTCGRGDLFAALRIQVPKTIGERERALWEELGAISKFSPRM